MIDCDDLLEHLHAQVRDQIHLAVIADAVPVAEMHMELAMLSQQQAKAAEELCEES